MADLVVLRRAQHAIRPGFRLRGGQGTASVEEALQKIDHLSGGIRRQSGRRTPDAFRCRGLEWTFAAEQPIKRYRERVAQCNCVFERNWATAFPAADGAFRHTDLRCQTRRFRVSPYAHRVGQPTAESIFPEFGHEFSPRRPTDMVWFRQGVPPGPLTCSARKRRPARVCGC